MLINISNFIKTHTDAIDALKTPLAKCRHIEIELENHHFPREVERRMNTEKQSVSRDVQVASRNLMELLRKEGATEPGEAEMAFRVIYNHLLDEIEQHEAKHNGKNGREKWMWIVGGPNGAGKSTFVASDYGSVAGYIPLVNPDDIARELQDASEKPAHIEREAGGLAIQRMRQYAQEGRSFIVESTLAGQYHKRLAKELKAKGWHIGMVFISNDSPDISVARVKQRVAKGGHDVPETDIRRRWQRAQEQMGDYLELTDLTYIIDNSSPQGFQLVASGRGGKVTYFRKDLLQPLMGGISDRQLIRPSVHIEQDMWDIMSRLGPNSGQNPIARA